MSYPNQSKVIPADLTERNNWFHSLTNKQKRLVIAQDALAQLQAGLYRTDLVCFLEYDCLLDQDVTSDVDLQFNGQQVFDRPGQQCRVCQRGALLVSAIRLGNNAMIPYRMTIDTYYRIESQLLIPIFGRAALELMEHGIGDRSQHNVEILRGWSKLFKRRAAQRWTESIQKKCLRRARMLEIMQQLIDHQGDLIIGGWKVPIPK